MLDCRGRVKSLHKASCVICSQFNPYQGQVMPQPLPGRFRPHSMLQDLGQVLRDKAPEQVAALEQLVADVHCMVAHL